MKPRILLDPDPAAMNTGRNGDGRFSKGNRAASNRRSRADWREAFDAACSPRDLRAIVKRAVRDAKAGDPRAREWVGSYCLQRPARLLDVRVEEAVELGPDGTEWDYLNDGPNPLARKYE